MIATFRTTALLMLGFVLLAGCRSDEDSSGLPDDIAALNIPTGIPLVYRLGDDFMPLEPGEYLDPEAAAAGAAAVAAQGRK